MKTKANVNWLIEDTTFDEQNRLIDVLKSKNMKYKITKYIPFGEAPKKLYNDNDCVIFYGSINQARSLLQHFSWTPLAWMNLTNLQCSTYYSHWGKYLLQQEYCFITFSELKRKTDFFYKVLGEADCIFVRPNNNIKTFTGSVVPKEKFEHWYKMTDDCYTPDKEMMVVVAKPQNILKEWRFVVCEREVLTGSLYKENGMSEIRPEIDERAKSLACEVAKQEWQPDMMYVLDIAETRSGFSLLEIGSFNTAGLYDCDFDIIVDKASELAIRCWSELNVV